MTQPALQLSLQFADASLRSLMPRHKVARWIRAALTAPAQITLRVVGEEEGLALNTRWRGQNHATNVLTFDYEREPVVVADLVLCAPVLVNESHEQSIDLQAHIAHLVVHGSLHAQGFDHLNDADAAVMEAQESAILKALGFADPYGTAKKLAKSAKSAKLVKAKPRPR